MPIIEATHLCKTYLTTKRGKGFGGAIKSLIRPERTEVKAVSDVNLTIEEGEIVGFLGPNGAGKTTTLKMLTGILYPTSGECHVMGYRPTDRKPEMLKRISLVMGNKQQLWWDLPAMDSFLVFKELYEVPDELFKKRLDQLIEALQLADKVDTQVRRLSLGERMKCELVAALLYAPKVIFLDEPTLGLDVVSQKRIREFLQELHEQDGSTIVLTSHYMQDVQELCQRVVIIDHGTLVFDGSLEKLAQMDSGESQIQLQFDRDVAEADLARFGSVSSVEGNTACLTVARAEVPAALSGILGAFPVQTLSVEEPPLEDVIRRLFLDRNLSLPDTK
ncbi:MAG: ATP-binding cassette domain-containing protein [Armatimonadetes bacterium]|nr:ATP-binding cassette domain-containing protein [Armatimonadota bacterium]